MHRGFRSRTSDLFEDAKQRLHVVFVHESWRDARRAFSQASISLRVFQTLDDCVSKAFGGGRVGVRQYPIDAGTEPVRDPSNRICGSGDTVLRSSQTDQPERLGPKAGHYQQICSLEETVKVAASDPSREFHGQI